MPHGLSIASIYKTSLDVTTIKVFFTIITIRDSY